MKPPFGLASNGGAVKPAKLARTLLLLCCLAVVLLLYLPRNDKSGEMDSPDSLRIPKELEDVVLAQFDNLVAKGLVHFEPSKPERLWHESFQFEFRIVSFLEQKPISSPTSLDRQRAGGPFVDPLPEEIVMDVGSAHRLLINKYSIYRPMLVLPTKTFALQTDDLDTTDITAAWSILKALRTPQMVLYNCGAGAGSSVGHKHLQIFPLPDMTLFPSQALSSTSITHNISGIPFKHYVYRIPQDAGAAEVFRLYQLLLVAGRRALRDAKAGSDYNVVFTAEWIALIPRRTAVWGGPHGANGAGMVGLVAVPNERQRQEWAELGYSAYLTKLGIPIS